MAKSVKIPLYLQIIAGMALGILSGLLIPKIDGGASFCINYIKPFGSIFIRLLQMLAIPLILSSLILGIANIKDMTKLSRIGGRTVLLFLCTALIATTLGIVLVNVIEPGKRVSEATRQELLVNYNNTSSIISKAESVMESPLQPIVEMVPENIFGAMSNNKQMLQVVFFALLFGVALAKVAQQKSEATVKFLDSINEALLKLVELVMLVAPFGVFALVSAVFVEMAGNDSGKALELLVSLGWYGLTVIIGLLIILLIVYPIVFKLFSNIGYGEFFKGMQPAFLLAFSSSSSSATLPVTMECVENNLKVSKEITGFVLPFGTTINMDGTALYQCVAAVFIAQVYGLDLSIAQQLTIIVAATLAAAGAAGIPGAGMITLIIVLKSAGIPLEGIALIMAPDRILDMFRTVINVAGDATAALVVEGKK